MKFLSLVANIHYPGNKAKRRCVLLHRMSTGCVNIDGKPERPEVGSGLPVFPAFGLVSGQPNQQATRNSIG